MPRKTNKMSVSLWCKTLLCVWIAVQFVFVSPTPAHAEDIASITKYLEIELTLNDKDIAQQYTVLGSRVETGIVDWRSVSLEDKFSYLVAFLKAHEKSVLPFNLSVGAGYNGHKAGESHLYKLDVSTKISYDIYPHTFRFDAATSAQVKNNELEENILSLLVNYDYHFYHWLEIYGFAERFSDSYLSILQRYETGGGIKFELDFLDSKWKKKIKSYKGASTVYKEMKKAIVDIYKDHDSTAHKDLLLGKLSALKSEGIRIVEALRKKKAWLSLGMAFTVLSELEKAEISSIVDVEATPANNTSENGNENGVEPTPEANDPEKFPLPAEHRFRFVLRPSFILRPVPNVSLSGMFYIKYPLGRPHRVEIEEGEWRRDYRMDYFAQLKLTLPKTPGWAKEIALVFAYQRHFDNLPPRMPKIIIEPGFKKTLQTPVAEDTHEVYVLSLVIKF